jgi:hypothetical protein
MKMRIKIKITIKKENEAKMSVYPPPAFPNQFLAYQTNTW